MKLSSCLILAAVLTVAGCGKEERAEGTRLAKILAQKQPDFAKAGDIERDFIASARAWCAGIIGNGGGRGTELDQNAAVATGLAKSVVAASTQLSQVRQPIYDLTLNKEYPQSVRAALITQLTKRQRQLQDMRALLEESAAQFLEYKNSRAYAGDTYPGGIGKMDALLKSYKEPDSIVGTALADLKNKYNLRDSDL